MTEPTPRRDFLFGRSGDDPAANDANDQREARPYLVHLARKAMAAEFEICLPLTVANDASPAAMEALDLVQSLEKQLSFFLPDSEISEINRTAAAGPVEVEPQLFSLLQWAMQLSHDTDGAYDLTSSPLWEAWGFARRAGSVPSPEQIAAARELVGWQHVELDAERQTVRFLRPGVRLNLGSIGKGFAVDQAVESMQSAGLSDFLVHGGYSSVAGRGAASGPAAGEQAARAPWTIGVKDPLRDDRRLGQIELLDRALGTSGAQFQSFRHQGRRYGHILDPRTGWPAEDVLAVTVLAPTAAKADALSTAFYVMGPQAALDYGRRHPEIEMILFAASGGNRWELHHFGLAAESADLLAALQPSDR